MSLEKFPDFDPNKAYQFIIQVMQWHKKTKKHFEKLKDDAEKEVMRILTNGPLPNPQVNYLQGQLDTIKFVLEALG